VQDIALLPNDNDATQYMEPLDVEHTTTLPASSTNDSTLDTDSTLLNIPAPQSDDSINISEATNDLLEDIPDKPMPGRREIREIRKESKMARIIRRVVTKKAKQIDARM
jgi:hypothetical protein